MLRNSPPPARAPIFGTPGSFRPPDVEVSSAWNETPNILWRELEFLRKQREERAETIRTCNYKEVNDLTVQPTTLQFGDLKDYRCKDEGDDLRFWFMNDAGGEWVPPQTRFALENHYGSIVKDLQRQVFVEYAMQEEGYPGMREVVMHNAAALWSKTSSNPASMERMVHYYHETMGPDKSRPQPKVVIFDIGADVHSYLPSDIAASKDVEVVGFGLILANLRTNKALTSFHFLDINKSGDLRLDNPNHPDQ